MSYTIQTYLWYRILSQSLRANCLCANIYRKALPLSVLIWSATIGRRSSVVKNVFRPLHSLRWYFGYAMFNTFRWIFRNGTLYKIDSMRMLHMQCHANSFAWTESHWTLRDGVNSLISSISYTKQSILFMHFLKADKMSAQVFRNDTVFVNQSVCQWKRAM